MLPAKMMVRALLPQIAAAIQTINEYDKQIAALESKLPSSRVFRSFPAAADAFAPRLVALFGRYASAAGLSSSIGSRRSGAQDTRPLSEL